jgi:LPS-assembly protein
VGGGLEYDDGYLAVGLNASRTGATHNTANNTSVTASIRLKAPAGLDLGHVGPVPVSLFGR